MEYVISVGANEEWAKINAKRINRNALAFAKQSEGKVLIFSTKEEAQEWADMFNGSYNQPKYAVIVQI